MPKAWGVVGGEQGPVTDRWWEQFGDERLNEIVERAVKDGFEVRVAWARLHQLEAVARQVESSWWPQASAQVDVGRRRSVLVLPPPVGVREFENDSFSISLPVSYELDVWDRIGSQSRAARADVMAARADIEAVAMTLTANVVEAWFAVVYQRALRRSLERQLDLGERLLELIGQRFEKGLASLSEWLTQRSQNEALRAQLPLTHAEEFRAQARLAILLGKMPEEAIVPPDRDELPGVLPLPHLGIPLDLLFKRPDLRAARLRVEAADHRVALAIADRLPRLTLSGSLGFSSPELANLFQSFVYGIVASIVGPLWDGGRREAVIMQNEAVLWERIEQLAQAMVTAVQEVESALAQEKRIQEQLQILHARAEVARLNLENAKERYAAGLLDGYLPVLMAQNALEQAEQALLTAKRQWISNRIQLYRSLGGSWTKDLSVPSPRKATESR
ncbi:MAG: TolC family protein [Sandaracinaceae bacterium]|nr:TolC family protein [Sandaracinaceae bacterium]